MNILFVLIPLGLGLLALAIAAFFWAVSAGQFDDLETPGTLVLFDDEPVGLRPNAGRASRPAVAGLPRPASTDSARGTR